MPPFNNGMVVRGNMTINLGAAFEVRFATGATTSRTHTIDGNLNIISANTKVVVQNGNTPVVGTLNIGGNLNITAGVFQGTSTGAGTGDAVVNLGGAINNTGGTIQKGNGSGVYTFNFTGTGNADLTLGAVDSFHHVTVAASKTVTLLTNKFTMATGKNLTLGGHFILGNFDLDMDGTITGGALASHVVTNGTGLLNKRNIANAANFYYPVGAAAGTFNPVTITNNDAATMDYGARVTNAITPAIGFR
ncbi:MAG: hypothetical protein IPI66_12855 [Chitinophagaceae bacterium]|nr:hypothetical protein [Chitinophagaceae bacterium]